MRRFGDLIASVGEFTDEQGRKAKRQIRCGALSVKVDAIPVAPGWSGWFAVRNVDSDSEGTA